MPIFIFYVYLNILKIGTETGDYNVTCAYLPFLQLSCARYTAFVYDKLFTEIFFLEKFDHV